MVLHLGTVVSYSQLVRTSLDADPEALPGSDPWFGLAVRTIQASAGLPTMKVGSELPGVVGRPHRELIDQRSS